MLVPTKKNISFGEISTVVFDQALPKSQANEVWYARSDYKNMRKESKSVDSHSDEKMRRNHITSILSLQQEHKDDGCIDAKGLQSFSSALSKHNTKMAQQRATLDCAEAFQLHSESCPEFLKVKTVEEYATKTRLRAMTRKSRSTHSIR